ncbi:partner and localizer of BRCA2 [Trichomycterus rosablanca]|uniref:partner and localizer of BRCA2 n=1 Tax=Trichomycterus rosablanca TaxID=2290929 RepID=UPI002F35157D
MSEEILTGEDKEKLKKRLELLQKEYERTAQRLQRAERREAVRKHVQKTISDQNRLLQINTPAVLEQSSSSSSVSSDLLSNQNLPSETTKVRFDLPEGSDASSLSSLKCRRSPSLRLRSKRSRLRLQIRERESDTDESQEKVRGGAEGTDETKRREGADKENHQDAEIVGDLDRGHKEERKQEAETNEDEKKDEDNWNPDHLSAERSSPEHSAVEMQPSSQLEATADQNSHSADIPKQSDEVQISTHSENQNGAASANSDVLSSCTLIEGLPFPVEYYVRTTRRMASAHSSVDINAVIQSQLSRGRGRRRSPKIQTPGPRPDGAPLEKPGCRRRGARGRRGRRGRGRTRDSESDSSAHSEAVPSSDPGPDFKRLSDSQLYLDCQLLPDSEVYPIFRKRRGQAGTSQSGVQANDVPRLLPPLSSLDHRNLGHVLTVFDVQDFHLPDDEFGRLKLERLCAPGSNPEPLVHGTGNNFRRNGNTGGHEARRAESERFVQEPLPCSATLENSLPLSQLTSTVQSQAESGQAERRPAHTGDDAQTFLQPDTKTSQSCLMLNLSMSLTSHTQQVDPGASFISLGASPDRFVPSSPSDPGVCRSSKQTHAENSRIHQTEELAKPGNDEFEVKQAGGSMAETHGHHNLYDKREHGSMSRVKNVPEVEIQARNQPNDVHRPIDSSPGLEEDAQLGSEVDKEATEEDPSLAKQGHMSPDVEVRALPDVSQEMNINSDILFFPEDKKANGSESEQANGVSTSPRSENQDRGVSELVDVEQDHQSSFPETRGNARLPDDVLTCAVTETSEIGHEIDSGANKRHKLDIGSQTRTEDQADLDNTCGDEDIHKSSGSNNETLTLFEDPVQPRADEEAGLTFSADGTRTDATESQIRQFRSRSALRKTHTLKALDGACVLDVCVVRWSAEDWCVCVAGEWSVCVWAQKAGVQQWDLLHTWTFTQSVISLQEVPDGFGLLCVSLGRLEIVEARILCCPGVDGPFSQADLCKDALQAVLAVSGCRVTCCSSPRPQQIVQVYTLARDGRVSYTRPLASCNHSVQTLAVVEGEKDALIGWTERKNLLIWNMKSGQLLQTIRLSETAPTATCLRGYSYRGVLCVLLQRAGACAEDEGSALFTLIATNPLTGKHSTLTSITNPTTHAERLMDGDTCESALAGVFQSGYLAVWDLRGGASCVYADKLAEVCRLARWAGPNVLLTGYLNGDVSLYQYKPVY